MIATVKKKANPYTTLQQLKWQRITPKDIKMDIRDLQNKLDNIAETVGDQDPVKNIDGILVSMNADHPGDIIADILHWCDANGEDFNDLVRRGTDYYRDEKADG